MPEPVMKVIRELTEFPRLRRGTLNVKVEEPHVHRRDYTLLPDDRPTSILKVGTSNYAVFLGDSMAYEH